MDSRLQGNMQASMQTIAHLMQEHGFSIGANMMQKGMAALPEPQRVGAGHVGTTPVSFAAAVPEVPALRDGSTTESPQDSQTTEPPQESPAKTTQAGCRYTAGVPGCSKAILRTGAGGSGGVPDDHGRRPYRHCSACTPAATATGEDAFEADDADGRKEDNCKTKQDAAPADTP